LRLKTKLRQYSIRLRMTPDVKRFATACNASGSETARKALSFLRKPTFSRPSYFSMKLWPFR
jgi:hypothetical protein